MRPGHGFTLVELLVVITIIVVLISLLAPAVDRAVYLTELTLCGTKLHTVGLASQTYAMNNRRHYPDRIVPPDGPSFNSDSADTLFTPPPLAPPERDLRKMIGTYLDINGTLNDALTRPVDFETSNESWCSVSYYMYFGYTFKGPGVGGPGMNRLGDRWTFTSPDDDVTRRFSVLAVDADKTQPSESNLSNCAHPDADGVLVNVVWQGVLATGNASSPLPVEFTGLANGEFIFSRWSGGYKRGKIDMNAAMDDGSVERFYEVDWQAGVPDPASPGSTYDERFTRVPHGAKHTDFIDNYINVPVR